MNFKYNVIKKDTEINLYFNLRKSFIDLLKPKNKKQFELYNAYSNIFINILFLKCHYSEKTEKFIQKFIKKYKNKLVNYREG